MLLTDSICQYKITRCLKKFSLFSSTISLICFFDKSKKFISTDTRNNLRRNSQNKTNSKRKYKKPNIVLAKMQHKSSQTLKLENTENKNQNLIPRCCNSCRITA